MEMMENTIWVRGNMAAVLVDGVEIPVETDYRVGLLLSRLMQDTTLPPVVRSRLFVRLACDTSGHDVDMTKLFSALLGFYGFTMVEHGTGDRPVFDLFADGERIVASFQAAYGIDLLHTSIHWHRFLALLRQLPSDTVLMQVIRLRMLDLREIEDDTLRYKLRQAKRAVQLPKMQKGESGYGEGLAGANHGAAKQTDGTAPAVGYAGVIFGDGNAAVGTGIGHGGRTRETNTNDEFRK